MNRLTPTAKRLYTSAASAAACFALATAAPGVAEAMPGAGQAFGPADIQSMLSTSQQQPVGDTETVLLSFDTSDGQGLTTSMADVWWNTQITIAEQAGAADGTSGSSAEGHSQQLAFLNTVEQNAQIILDNLAPASPTASTGTFADTSSTVDGTTGDSPTISATATSIDTTVATYSPSYSSDGFVSQSDLQLVLLNWANDTTSDGFDLSSGPISPLASGTFISWGSGEAPSLSAGYCDPDIPECVTVNGVTECPSDVSHTATMSASSCPSTP